MHVRDMYIVDLQAGLLQDLLYVPTSEGDRRAALQWGLVRWRCPGPPVAGDGACAALVSSAVRLWAGLADSLDHAQACCAVDDSPSSLPGRR